jgi:hypothetical protein
VSAQVLAVEREQVEGEQEHRARAVAFGQGGAQALEIGHPTVVHHHAFAIDGGGRDGQRAQRFDDQRHLVRPVLGIAREHAHPVAIAPGDKPEAIVLKLEGPATAVWHGARRRRQAGFDETGGVGRRGHGGT